MKKLLVTLTAIALLTMSLFAVSAAEPVQETTTFTSNMDADTYLELRTQQLDDALAEGTIDQEQYDLLLAHIEENVEEGSFGRGPQGYLTADTEDCVLGEDGNLGIFRNANSGLRNGQGNGIGNRNADGTGSGSRGSRGGNGMRLQDGSAGNVDCIIN